jgi:CDP-glucose 4,6-dehydratase
MTSFWSDRPTLVTGATGLLGGWLVRDLAARGAEVVCLVRDRIPRSQLLSSPELLQQVTLVRGDVRDQPLLERVLNEYSIDTVMHLAAQTIVPIANRGPVATFETNIAGTWSLLEACRRNPHVRQIVVASSDKAYGDNGEAAYREDTPLRGRFPYDVSKSCADLIATAYAATYDLPVAITRCGNFYGGGDLNWNRLVPGTIRSALRGERPVIRSDGRLRRDYLYVEDGVAGYRVLAECLAADPRLRGEAFNFAAGGVFSALDLTQRILRLMGSRLTPRVLDEARGEIPAQQLDASHAREVLGWRPRFSIDEGLRRTMSWYRAFLDVGQELAA